MILIICLILSAQYPLTSPPNVPTEISDVILGTTQNLLNKLNLISTANCTDELHYTINSAIMAVYCFIQGKYILGLGQVGKIISSSLIVYKCITSTDFTSEYSILKKTFSRFHTTKEFLANASHNILSGEWLLDDLVGFQSIYQNHYYDSGINYANALYSTLLGPFIADSFDPSRIRLIDHYNSNILFRGNIPEIDGAFDYNQLIISMRQCAQSQGISFPDNFTLVDISLLNQYQDHYPITAEQYGIKGYKNIEYHRFPFYGNQLNARKLSELIRKPMVTHLDLWTFDDLNTITDKLHTYIHSDSSPYIVYYHCIHGTDRTGEITGAYKLRYLGYDYDRVLKENNHIIDRKMVYVFEYQMNWYCWYLQYVNNYTSLLCQTNS